MNNGRQDEAELRALEDAYELSCALSTGLSRNDVAMILTLTEAGINAQAIAEVVKTLRAEQAAAARRQRQQ
ncbi:hypothetical protein BU14_1367s0003 [Porphyra umbilicalis]|uniref:Mitotic-spindle organizing protein 1 n=1 Tax=Porphyra umbilicalis TaxID=2786 RepID=A0A1X6NLR7_PORUM|nr:hypothetical protein BU14_1367s0003 [Porphyra umbilicalis]|eukprot:OSX69589.1 hypothetical protein BU14_1367s0003 [Porphyra umbilicalis]